MVLITVEEGKQFYLSKRLKNELDPILYSVKSKNQDAVIIIDGDEGGGKSKTARMIAFYCAKVLGSKFCRDSVKNIHNDIDKYIQSSIDGPNFMVNILDESRKILNRKRSTSRDAVRFTDYLSECRSKNQVHILLLPTYHDLDRYVAQWRMTMCIHMFKMWTPDEKIELGGHELHIGAFKLYINNHKMRYFYDQKGFMYPKQYVCKDRFSNVEVLSEQGELAYEAQKEGLVRSKYLPEDTKLTDKPLDDERLLTALEKNSILKKMRYNAGKMALFIHKKGFKYTEIARECGFHSTMVSHWVKAYRDVENGTIIIDSLGDNLTQV